MGDAVAECRNLTGKLRPISGYDKLLLATVEIALTKIQMASLAEHLQLPTLIQIIEQEAVICCSQCVQCWQCLLPSVVPRKADCELATGKDQRPHPKVMRLLPHRLSVFADEA